jgi:hypothetical protein
MTHEYKQLAMPNLERNAGERLPNLLTPGAGDPVRHLGLFKPSHDVSPLLGRGELRVLFGVLDGR